MSGMDTNSNIKMKRGYLECYIGDGLWLPVDGDEEQGEDDGDGAHHDHQNYPNTGTFHHPLGHEISPIRNQATENKRKNA